jgi:hypothetical protein
VPFYCCWMTPMGLVAQVRDADGRRVALDDPSGGRFDAAGDFDRLIPARSTHLPLLSSPDPYGEWLVPFDRLTRPEGGRGGRGCCDLNGMRGHSILPTCQVRRTRQLPAALLSPHGRAERANRSLADRFPAAEHRGPPLQRTHGQAHGKAGEAP